MLCSHLGHRLANGLMRQHRGPLLGELDEQDFFWLASLLTALKRIKQTPQLRQKETGQYPEGTVDLLEELNFAAESGQNRKCEWLMVEERVSCGFEQTSWSAASS